MAIQPKVRTAAVEYFQLPEYAQHDHIQLIDGEVIVSVPPILRHQDIVGEIFAFFLVIAKKLGGKAYVAPTEVYLDEHNVYEPDVLYLVPETRAERTEKRIVGAPDLVVEVLSPSTAKFDRQEKYRAYERYGVKEYWIADPIHDVLEVWTLNNGQFVRQGAYGVNDTFTCATINETVAVKAFFAS